MFKYFMAAVCVLFLNLIPTTESKAEVTWQDDARVRLLLHGGKELAENFKLMGHFIPSGNLVGELAPLMYIGGKFSLPSGWSIEPAIGYYFGAGENSPIAAFRIEYDGEYLYSWSDVEYNPLPDHGLYWFSQLEYKALDWLQIGIEGEGWGSATDADVRSDGGGVNVLFVFKMIQVDLAVHYRSLMGTTDSGFEFVSRFHAFLF